MGNVLQKGAVDIMSINSPESGPSGVLIPSPPREVESCSPGLSLISPHVCPAACANKIIMMPGKYIDPYKGSKSGREETSMKGSCFDFLNFI
jgi:hypothetical protein